AVHRLSAAVGAPVETLLARGLMPRGAAAGDRPLQAVEQAVEIDRHEIGRMYAGEVPAVRQPSGAEIPAALGCGADVAIDLRPGPARGARYQHIVAVGLIARRVRSV